MNKLPKIISFSGRKRSGKTELAKLCLKYGYELINFADGLKDLICNILEITREQLEEFKDYKKIYKLNDKISFVSKEVNIDEKIVEKFLLEPFDSIRSILQIIGTNLIRNHNPLWHINKVKQQIINNPDKYYCIGDTRFLNEKQMINELNGECWFIIRPNMFEISNHYSEIDLKWCDFHDNIIINNVHKDVLSKKWENYLENLRNDDLNEKVLNTFSKKELRYKLINLLKEQSPIEISKQFNLNVISWCDNLMINLNKKQYTFLDVNKESSYIMGVLTNMPNSIIQDGYNCILNLNNKDKYIVDMYKKLLNSHKKICFNHEKQIYSLSCDNPFVIENIKLWNLKPKNSNQEVPYLLLNNLNMLKYWIIGLIDSNGIISYKKITIIASQEIINYLYDMLTYGNINNNELTFVNENAIKFYNWLGDSINISLKRKWNKL